MDFAGPDALLERIATEKKNVVFLVGSPLTAPTGGSGLGIPGVAGIIERIRSLLKDWPSTLKELDGQIATSPNPYQTAFRFLGQRRSQDVANALIRSAVLEAYLPAARPRDDLDEAKCRQLENDLDGWHYPPAVEALGKFIAAYPERFGHTVLTSNFDPLVKLSIQRAAFGARTGSPAAPPLSGTVVPGPHRCRARVRRLG